MKHRPDTPEGVEEMRRLAAEQEINLRELHKTGEEIRLMAEAERIDWCRRSQQLKRDILIYPETLTPEQVERLSQIEKELIDMAHRASEETKTKTILKGS